MKRFIILLIICFAGYFSAPMTLGRKMRPDSDFTNQGIYSAEDKEICGMVRSVAYSKDVPVCSITMMLNLSAAEQLNNETELVTVKANHSELGLMISKEGIVGQWQGSPWRTHLRVPLSQLIENINVQNVKGDECISLTMLVSGSTDPADKTPGVTLVDASGEVVLSLQGLNSAYNRNYTAVNLNKELVSHSIVSPRLLSVRGAGKRSARLAKAVSRKPGNALVAYGAAGVLLMVLSGIWAAACPARRKKADASALRLQSLSSH